MYEYGPFVCSSPFWCIPWMNYKKFIIIILPFQIIIFLIPTHNRNILLANEHVLSMFGIIEGPNKPYFTSQELSRKKRVCK